MNLTLSIKIHFGTIHVFNQESLQPNPSAFIIDGLVVYSFAVTRDIALVNSLNNDYERERT